LSNVEVPVVEVELTDVKSIFLPAAGRIIFFFQGDQMSLKKIA
jgi:hypothetical protein